MNRRVKATSIGRRAAIAVLAGSVSTITGRLRAAPPVPFEERFRDLIKAAQAEGEVTWYEGSLEAAGRDYAELFQKRFGIKVNHVFIIGSPAFERFRAEARAGKRVAEVINVTDSTLMIQLMKEDLIDGYRTASIDDFPEGWVMRLGNGIAYPTARVQSAFMYNTQAVSPEKAKLLKQWTGLLDPSFGGGRMGMADATRVGGAYAAYYYLLRSNAKQYGIPYLTKLRAQDPVLFDGTTQLAAQIGSGALDLGFALDSVGLQQYSLGAPVGFIFPDPTPGTLLLTGIAKNSPHPNAARLFMEYATSDEGMVEWGKLWRAGLGRPQLDARVDQAVKREPWYSPPPQNFVITDWDAAIRDHDEVIREWAALFKS